MGKCSTSNPVLTSFFCLFGFCFKVESHFEAVAGLQLAV